MLEAAVPFRHRRYPPAEQNAAWSSSPLTIVYSISSKTSMTKSSDLRFEVGIPLRPKLLLEPGIRQNSMVHEINHSGACRLALI